MTTSCIPIVIAVSGHRDIPPQDAPALRAALAEYFDELRRRYPHSPFQLLSGLADGADRLAATVAIERDFELVAVLPFTQNEYERDFVTIEALADFRLLLAKASRTFVVPAGVEAEDSRDCAYVRLGCFLVEHAQVVVAVWDGVTHQTIADGSTALLPGGTADVVRLCREGVLAADASVVDLPEITQVRHLYSRRQKQQAVPAEFRDKEPGTWIIPADTSPDFAVWQRGDAILQSIDRFNHFSTRLPPQAVAQSRAWLVGENPPDFVSGPLSNLVEAFSAADAASTVRSTQRIRAIRFISALAMISIAMQQVYSGPDMRWGWLAGHIGVAVLAYWIFRQFFRGYHPCESEYLDWRALAEGLRVQIFWAAAAQGASVADHYLVSDSTELDWIRHAIRNINLQCRDQELSPSPRWVQRAWIEDQGKWFAKKWPLQKGLESRLSFSVNIAFFGAMALTLLTLMFHLMGADDSVLNSFVLVSGMAFLLSAVLKAYSSQMAYEEQYQRYRDMAALFSTAAKKMPGLYESRDEAAVHSLLLALGREALMENADWLRLHRQRQFEVNLG